MSTQNFKIKNGLSIGDNEIIDSSGNLTLPTGATINVGGAPLDALPDQANNSGKYLTTDGSAASWETITQYTPPTDQGSGNFLAGDGTYKAIDVSTDIATAVAALVDSAPSTLDTLNELAASLGDDANFATTVSTSLGTKVDKTTTVNGHALSGNVTVTKSDVSLGNVDNTSDASKPVSTAQATAIGLKADSTTVSSHTSNTSNPHSVTKAQVGLGNVDNTSDASKPVSTAQQTALNLKADSSTVSSHTGNTSNPHSTTAAQVGAYTKLETEQLVSDTLLAVPQNIVPETDSIYSLGTSALKWSELHLSGSAIHLGDVTLKDNGDGTFGIYDKTGQVPVTIQSGEKVYATEDYVDTMAYTKVNMSVMDDMRDPTGFVRALPDTMGIIEFSPNGTDIYQIDQHSYFSKRSDGTFATGTIYETEAVAKRVVIYPVPSTGFIRLYSDAVKYEFTTLKYADVSSLDAMRYLYMDGSGLHASNLLDKELFFTNVALTTVIYGNDDTGIKLVFGDERHGIQMDGATHRYQHFTEGSKYYDGLEIQGVTNGSNTYTSTTGGTIYDEDIINSIELMTSNPFWYIDGTIWRTSTPNNNLSYNNKYCLESNGTYSLVDIPSGKYSCTHFLATNDREYPVVKIVGQSVYDTIDSARDLIITEASNVKLYGLPTPELIYIGSIIINDAGQAQELSDGSIITDLRKTKITGRGSESSVAAYASAVIYNNDNSGLTSTSVQNAITELAQEKAEISSVTSSLALKANIASPTFTGTVSGITKAMVGLSNVDNTADTAKPVSTAQATAIGLKVTANSNITAGTATKITYDAKGLVTSGTTLSASDIPSLDASKITSGTIDAARLPSYVDDVIEGATTASFPTTGETGKIYVALDTNKAYRWSGSAYVYITSGAVDSVAGRTGVVTLTKSDVGLSNVDNTSDVNKPVSTATQTALNLKANLASPTFTGTVGGITASMVGLGNVTNESKATMFTSPTFTGTVSGITSTMVGLGNVENKSSTTIRSEITSSNVTTALGYIPSTAINATNTTANQTTYIVGVTAAGSNQTPYVSSTNGVYFNPNTGTLYAVSKSFIIDHPTKDGMKLQYACLEGPENGVYVRGKLKGSNIIELPDYWVNLVEFDSITVNLTGIGQYQSLYVKSIEDNKVIIANDLGDINCFYTVYAERKDIDKLEVEIVE